jgi:hypothetical protein
VGDTPCGLSVPGLQQSRPGVVLKQFGDAGRLHEALNPGDGLQAGPSTSRMSAWRPLILISSRAPHGDFRAPSPRGSFFSAAVAIAPD